MKIQITIDTPIATYYGEAYECRDMEELADWWAKNQTAIKIFSFKVRGGGTVIIPPAILRRSTILITPVVEKEEQTAK